MGSDQITDAIGGWIEFRARGHQPERLVNLAVTRGISLWHIRQSAGVLVARVRPDKFVQICDLADSAGVRIKVLAQGGVRSALKRARRWWLFGLLMMVVLCYGIYLTTFIWFVEVVGTDQLPEAAVLSVAREHGLQPGAARSSIDTDAISRALVAADDSIAWAAVEMIATRARIEIVERTPEHAHLWLKLPGDIVAADSAVIEQIIIISGVCQVAVGDVVSRGDILIQGGEAERARGVVRAVVWYEGYGEAKTVKTEAIATGREASRVLMKIGNWEIILTGRSIQFIDYEIRSHVRQLLPWRNTGVTVEVVRQRIWEVEREVSYVSVDEAQRIAANRAIAAAYRLVCEHARVASMESTAMSVTDDTVGVRTVVKTRQDIGRFVPARVLKMD